MHTIPNLRKALGLTTANQVRNRIEAIKDLLAGDLRRGPNNQILVSDAGLDLLRRLQELYDSGLTLTEASEILRASTYSTRHNGAAVSSAFSSNRVTPGERDEAIAALKEEIAFLRERVAYLESRLAERVSEDRAPTWWEGLREDVDAP